MPAVAVVSQTELVIFDRYEANPLEINGHPAFAAVYDLELNVLRPMDLLTHSFVCCLYIKYAC